MKCSSGCTHNINDVQKDQRKCKTGYSSKEHQPLSGYALLKKYAVGPLTTKQMKQSSKPSLVRREASQHHHWHKVDGGAQSSPRMS